MVAKKTRKKREEKKWEKIKKRKVKPEYRKGVFRVAIFGSARIKRKNLVYKQVHSLAERLGERGFGVVTGGGPGLMEAANSGHKKGIETLRKQVGNVEIKSIGLGIKLPWEQKFNEHLDLKEEFEVFSNRLDRFMALSNAIVVTPGGIGTLLELFYSWQLEQVHHIENVPIILLGKQWPSLIKWIEDNLLKSNYIHKKDLSLVFLAKDVEEAMKTIDKAYEYHKKGITDFSRRHQRYRLD